MLYAMTDSEFAAMLDKATAEQLAELAERADRALATVRMSKRSQDRCNLVVDTYLAS